jgi:transposase
MPKKKTGYRYTQEFKAEAVQLARSYPEQSIRQLSAELGISDQTLSNWVKQAQIDRGERQGLTSQEREKLRRLRKEVRILREEREILKEAAVDSTGQCNSLCQCSSRSAVPEGLARPRVELLRDQVEVGLIIHR